MLVAFINNKGGVGKSTLAVHAAAWLHEHGRRVVLLDADAQASSSQWLSKVQPKIPIVRLTQVREIVEQAPRIQLACDTVVADGPAALDGATAALLGIAQKVILPVGPSMLEINATYQTVRMGYRLRFKHQQLKKQEIFIVFTRVQPRTRLAKLAAAAILKYGFPVAPVVIQMRQAYAEAAGLGTVVWHMTGSAIAAAVEITSLFETLFSIDGVRSIADEQLAALQRARDAVVLKQCTQELCELPVTRPNDDLLLSKLPGQPGSAPITV